MDSHDTLEDVINGILEDEDMDVHTSDDEDNVQQDEIDKEKDSLMMHDEDTRDSIQK